MSDNTARNHQLKAEHFSSLDGVEHVASTSKMLLVHVVCIVKETCIECDIKL